MTGIAQILNGAAAQSSLAVSARPMDNSGSGSQASSASTITANDFLKLLVTEMKNQDPTSATDPNQYINQLVSVNSLEQLIQINQTLSAAVSPVSGASRSTNPSSQSLPGSGTTHADVHTDRLNSPAGESGVLSSTPATALPLVPGNLGISAANPAAQRIAQALGGNTPPR